MPSSRKTVAGDSKSKRGSDAASSALLEGVMQRERLSARSFDRIIRVARTIADLAGEWRAITLPKPLMYRRT
jgi:magnesium chelatase family protein